MASPSLLHSFAGKRVLITGGARGIGAGIVRKFYNDGAIVYVLDKLQPLLDKLKSELPKIQTICVDLLNWEATQDAVSAISPLDHLVNNAGVFQGESILEMTKEHFDFVFGINLKSVICVTQAFVNGNIKNGSANGTTIVNTSSVADRRGFSNGATYCASKAGVTSLTKTMAIEFGKLNIRANCVCPTYVETELARSIGESLKTDISGSGKDLLTERCLEPSDITNAVLFLSSPFSSKITGISLPVDSGYSAH